MSAWEYRAASIDNATVYLEQGFEPFAVTVQRGSGNEIIHLKRLAAAAAVESAVPSGKSSAETADTTTPPQKKGQRR